MNDVRVKNVPFPLTIFITLRFLIIIFQDVEHLSISNKNQVVTV